MILIHQREDGIGLRNGRKKGKPEHRGVTRRAIKELFIFVPWTEEETEGGFFPDPLKKPIGQTWQ